MKKPAGVLLITCFFALTQSNADDCQGAMSATLNSMGDAINYGKDVGNNCHGQTIASTTEQNAVVTAQSIDANQSNYASSQYYGRDLNISLQAGNAKINKCSGDLTGLSNKDKADCEAVEFAAKNGHQRPKYQIDNYDALVADSKDTINKADISSEQNFCRVVKTKIPALYERKQCFATVGEVQESCTDSIDTSQCLKDTVDYSVGVGGVVIDSLKKISQTAPNSSSTRWFVQGFPAHDILFSNQYLKIVQNGRANYAIGSYDAEYSFEIKNLAQLDRAVIRSYVRDDGLRVFINGKMAIDDSYGHQTSGYRYVNKDIKSYLVEGVNTIKTQVYNNTRHVVLDMFIDIPVYKGDCQKNVQTTCTAKHKSSSMCKLIDTQCTQTSADFFDIFGNVGSDAMGYCANKTYTMMCQAPMVNECSQEELRGCEQLASECTEKDVDGKCVTYNQTYQCKKTEERVVEATQCEQKLCNGENCIGNQPEADGDFGKAIAMMEAQRQAGVYGKTPMGYNIFDGDPSVCSVKVFAGHNIMSCCKSIETGDKFKNRTQGGIATQTYGNAPNQPAFDNRGSQYVYDNVFDQNKTLAVIQSTLTLGWLQCNQEEKTLAIKRGSGLCEYSHEWCSKKTFFGSCTEKKRQYCCYRSTLAKIINQQGRIQLGKGAGCDGFTIEELEKLDFSKMDLSEFINEIVPADIDVEQRKRSVQSTVEQNFGKEVNYYDR